MSKDDTQESAQEPFSPENYPLVDPGVLTDLERLAARDPRALTHRLQEVLGKNSIRVAQGQMDHDAMRQLEQAAGQLLRLHPIPVPQKPSEEIQKKMEQATRAAARRATRHPEYDGGQEEVRQHSCIHRPNDPSHCNVTAGICFNKNGRTMMVNPHKTEIDYDYPEMTKEGRKFLQEALEQAAREAGLELKDGVSIALQADEKGWVSIGYHWTSAPAGRC